MLKHPLKNPPGEVYAFVHKRLEHQVMGLAIDSITGEPIEAVILPTRQRVMLGLGVGNEEANIHHKYRRRYRHGYEVIWITDAKTDRRLAKFRGEPTVDPESAKPPETRPAHGDIQHPEPAPAIDSDSVQRDITTKLMQAGVDRGRAESSAARSVDKPASPAQVDEATESVRESVQEKPKQPLDMFGGI